MAQASDKIQAWIANHPDGAINSQTANEWDLTNTQVSARVAKLSELSATTVSVAELNALDADSTSVSIGLSATSVANAATINTTVQFKDAAGENLAYPVAFDYYISSDAAGLLADAAITTIADGGAGSLVGPYTAHQSGKAVTNAAGLCDLDLTEAGADIIHLVVVSPSDGRLTVSGSMTFAAA